MGYLAAHVLLIVLLASSCHSAKSADWKPLIKHILTSGFEFGLEILLDELYDELDQYLDTKYPEWKNLKILKTADALKKLNNFRKEVMDIIQTNKGLYGKIKAKFLTYNMIIKYGPKMLKGGATYLNHGFGIGIVADLVQEGLEYAGHETAGKGVGAAGNIASGAAIGAGFGGPLGAVVGAAGGYLFWKACEVEEVTTAIEKV
jgi:hypothetical protein